MYKNLVTAVMSTRAVACFSFFAFSALAPSPAAVPVSRSDAPILALKPHPYAAGTP